MVTLPLRDACLEKAAVLACTSLIYVGNVEYLAMVLGRKCCCTRVVGVKQLLMTSRNRNRKQKCVVSATIQKCHEKENSTFSYGKSKRTSSRWDVSLHLC